MPPMVEEDVDSVSDGPEDVPARAPKAVTEVDETEAVEDADSDEDNDEEEDGEEFRVEKILKHDFSPDGEVRYQIKWLGYDKKSDLTWEPIGNLDNAMELVQSYHDEIGGPPVAPDSKKASAKKGKGGKRKVSDTFDSPGAGSGNQKKRKSNGVATEDPPQRTLPDGSWENHVTRVASIIEEGFPAVGKKKEGTELLGLLEWNDGGAKTQHKLKVLRAKCPQKLLDYYEQHLRFQPMTDE